MKKILILAVLFIGTHAYANKLFQPDPVYAANKEIGGVTSHGKEQYMVSYRISITNPLTDTASLTKGCFVLFDRTGKEIVARGVDVVLLQAFKPGESKTGMVFFFGDNADVLNMPFVKWISSDSGENSNVDSNDNPNVEGSDNSNVEGNDNSKVDSNGNSKFDSNGNSKFDGNDNSKVDGNDNSKVDGNDNSKVEGSDNAKVESSDNCKGESQHNSKADISGHSQVSSDVVSQ